MERVNASMVSRQFKRTFDEASLNELGKATQLCRSERDATPYRLMLTLVEAFAVGTVESRSWAAAFASEFDSRCSRNRSAAGLCPFRVNGERSTVRVHTRTESSGALSS